MVDACCNGGVLSLPYNIVEQVLLDKPLAVADECRAKSALTLSTFAEDGTTGVVIFYSIQAVQCHLCQGLVDLSTVPAFVIASFGGEQVSVQILQTRVAGDRYDRLSGA